MWTMLGCIISHRLFPPVTTQGLRRSSLPKSFEWSALLQCMLVTWLTNISINYANEYFDWNLDNPGQNESIKIDIRKREAIKRGEISSEEFKREFNEKIAGNTTRIIHDGTFPAWIALMLAIAVESLLGAIILSSRSTDPDTSSRAAGSSTPYKGAALVIAAVSTVLSHEYIAPPLRLHYRGVGELMSAFLLSPASVLWGMSGYYTATHRPLSFSDFVPRPSRGAVPAHGSHGWSIDASLLMFFCAIYLLEQARIFVMHIHDIKADKLGGKITLSVHMGHYVTSVVYVVLNLLGLGAIGVLLQQARSGRAGLLYSIAGKGGWKLLGAWGTVLALAIPIMITTASTLFANAPGRNGKRTGFLPVVALSEPPKLVSIQVLATPIILSLFLGVF